MGSQKNIRTQLTSYRIKMEGCMSNLVKYLLFTTNFPIFILGVAVFGCGIWVLVDQPSFMNLFDQATQNVPELTENFDITLYASAAYILLVVSALVVIISFFGCCGAFKESKCMLGTYFTLILAMFIVMVVGAVLGYSGDLEKTIKEPLKNALSKYRDDVTQETDEKLFFYKEAWNEVQYELKCCGVDDVTDWSNSADGTDFQWNPDTANKPLGCCRARRDSPDQLSEAEQKRCRELPAGEGGEEYCFAGCYTMFKDKIEDNQNVVVGVAIGVVVVMFLNMMFSFAMCTMVK